MLYIEKRSGLPFQTESGWWIQVSSIASCCAATSFFSSITTAHKYPRRRGWSLNVFPYS